MIEINRDEIIEIGTFKPFADSKEDLLQELYGLIPKVHKEPNCLSFELFIDENATVITVGKWRTKLAFDLHKNMQYIDELSRLKLPVFCERFDYQMLYGVIPPLTALSLLNE